MKNIKRLVLVSLMALFLVGCGKGTADAKKNCQDVTPSLTVTGNGNGYSYLIDNNTGVVYLKYDNTNQCAISVMLNADGTPVTAKQLEIEY